MTHALELYWDFSSPFAYLGSTQAEALAQRTGATLVWRPMLLGAVFKAIGTADAPILTWSEAKRQYFFFASLQVKSGTSAWPMALKTPPSSIGRQTSVA